MMDFRVAQNIFTVSVSNVTKTASSCPFDGIIGSITFTLVVSQSLQFYFWQQKLAQFKVQSKLNGTCKCKC